MEVEGFFLGRILTMAAAKGIKKNSTCQIQGMTGCKVSTTYAGQKDCLWADTVELLEWD